MQEFSSRQDAGARLAARLGSETFSRPVVLALPRGGVPVAEPVARALGAPLDLLMVRKIGTPGQPELAAGAVVDGPARATVFNTEIIDAMGLAESDFDEEVQRQLDVIAERRRRYLGDRAPVPLQGRDAIVIDDGIATGATVRAALTGLARRAPGRIILAVPVAPRRVLDELRPLVDRIVCLVTPDLFRAVGMHYASFPQVTDDEVATLMSRTEGDADDA